MKLTLQSALSGEHDELLNVTLCKWLGWTGIKQWPLCRPTGYSPSKTICEIPNHINGESALWHCHLAEKILKEKRLFFKYYLALAGLPRFGGNNHFHTFNATSIERVVAMLLTVKPEMFSC